MLTIRSPWKDERGVSWPLNSLPEMRAVCRRAADSHALSEKHHAVPSSSLLLWVLLWHLACEIAFGSKAWQIAYQQKVS